MSAVKIPSPATVLDLAEQEDPKLTEFLKDLSKVMCDPDKVKGALVSPGLYRFRIMCIVLGERNKAELAKQLLSAGWRVTEHTELQSGHNEYDTILTLRATTGGVTSM